MPNVVKLPGVFRSDRVQVIQDFSMDDFCTLLEASDGENVENINGMTILNYPKIILICSGDRCTSVSAAGASVETLLRGAHALLEPSAVA